MRIVHIANTFSNLSETFLYDLINIEKEYGNECHVLTFTRVNKDVRPYPEHYIHEIRRSGLDYRRYLNYIKALLLNRPKETANWDLYRNQLKQKLKLIKPDVIHAHFGDMGILIEPVAKVLNIPLVVTFHGYDISILPKKTFWDERYQNLFETASALIGVSNHVCKKVKRVGAGSEKVYLIHNGIDTEKFCPEAEDKKENDTFNFIFIGRFVEKKAPLLLLKSYQYFVQNFSVTTSMLRMVGDGPLLKKAKHFANENKMEDYVAFPGFVNHKEIPEILQSSDVYVQHSVTADNGDEEGMGVTLAEASASGIPVIVTDHNGFPDVVLDTETGYLVSERDYEEMGRKMYKLYNNFELRNEMGRKGREHINVHFEKSKQAQKVIELYKKISSG